MKNVNLKRAEKDAKSSAIYTKNKNTDIYEGSFIKNAFNKAKDFLKTGKNKLKRMGKSLVKKLKKDASTKKSPSMFVAGSMVTYQYNAKDKTKKFDKQPLGICLGESKEHKGNFLLLNFHWLKMSDRVAVASFFVELNKKRNGKLTYQDVKPWLTKFKGHPVLRMYIYSRVKERVIHVQDSDLFLKTAAIDTADWFKP